MLSLEAREFFKIFVLFCYITNHLMTGPLGRVNFVFSGNMEI